MRMDFHRLYRRAVGAAVLLLAAAAPLGAQPSARRLPTCVHEASITARSEMTRYGCAGAGSDAAVRLSANLPTNWQIAWQDTSELVLTAMDGDNALWIVGADRLPAPITRRDTADYWRAATELAVLREVSDDEVEDFRDANNGRITSAREWATTAQLADSVLLSMVQGLSATRDGKPVLHQETGVRPLAGEPAGYLSEVLEIEGRQWRFTSYVTLRDGALFIVSLNTLEEDFEEMLPLYEQVLASFNPRTERW
jgi:hypothetical protein